MKRLIVAKLKWQLAALVGIYFVALVMAAPFVPEQYFSYFRAVWIVWFLLAGWLAWSIIGKLIFTAETVKIAPEVQDAFNRFEESMKQLTDEQTNLSQNIQDAVTYQRELVNVLIGFIEQAEMMQAHWKGIKNPGKATFYDPTLGRLMKSLDKKQLADIIQTEMGILQAQEDAYRRQAQSILNRVMEARGQIAQQRLKLNQTEAAVPLLQMGRALEVCERQLVYLNEPMSINQLGANVKQKLLS